MAEQETTLRQEFEKWLTAQKNAMLGDGYINPFTAWEVAQYFHQLGERQERQRCDLAVLELRCERGTPWDLAILAASRVIRGGESNGV